ncbi:MAG TPA: IPT/TIG domain-containing protein [Bryobacteraceae bacterium]|nr:IPT/TIG domain-containing protein [Bryobacteraceae bacterium]
MTLQRAISYSVSVLALSISASLAGAQGIITTVAGNGTIGGANLFSGDGGPATAAALNAPNMAVADSAGNLYIADTGNSRIRKVETSGTITTFAGNGTQGFSGDGGPATSAALFFPSGVVLDNAGNVYIIDDGNECIRRVDKSGIITTVAGGGHSRGPGLPALGYFLGPTGLAFDTAGNMYITDTVSTLIYKVDKSGTLAIFAGNGVKGFTGDGGPATSAELGLPSGLAFDKDGNLFFVDVSNHRIRKISTSGIISTIAGTARTGFAGDGGPAADASFGFVATNDNQGLAFDSAGNLYIADTNSNRIRMIDKSGIINTVAGSAVISTTPYGDGKPATMATLLHPYGVTVDSAGNLYIADTGHNKIRKVTAPGVPGSGNPAISANGVVNGASFQPGIVTNSWATIVGTNLASGTDTWANAIVNGNLPTGLDNVTVTIGGRPAYLEYVSPLQINMMVPDVSPGPEQVVVTNQAGTSASYTVNVSQFGPAFFLWPSQQAVATRQDYSYAAKNGTFSTVTAPAQPGDVLILWGTGFGPTSPAVTPGIQVPSDQTYSTATLPTVTINNVSATVYGAALAPGFAGLYQVAIQVPPSLISGDWPIVASIGGVQSPSGVILSVIKPGAK